MSPDNILIVDDSPSLHKIIKAQFGSDRVVVHSAYDGEAGLIKTGELQPNLILMDIDMPGPDGLEICRQLKADPLTAGIPVIFLTADCSTYDKVKAFEMGAVDFITKPFQPEEVRARVHAALRRKAGAEQQVMIDSVTGLWNQSYLDVQLPAQLSLSRRTGDPMSCIVAEVDGIEQIYQRHGASVAERIIKSITGTFAGMSRSEDVLCHVGGGRVVFLQTATSEGEAMLHMELMRREIERQLLYLEFMGAGITCSFGVADTRGQGAGSLFDAAEEALSQAKHSGGNSVATAGQRSDLSLAA